MQRVLSFCSVSLSLWWLTELLQQATKAVSPKRNCLCHLITLQSNWFTLTVHKHQRMKGSKISTERSEACCNQQFLLVLLGPFNKQQFRDVQVILAFHAWYPAAENLILLACLGMIFLFGVLIIHIAVSFQLLTPKKSNTLLEGFQI